MRTSDLAVPVMTPHPLPPGAPLANWDAGLRIGLELLPQAAYTWDDTDASPVPPVPGDPSILLEPFNNFTSAPWTVTGTPTIVAGRTGTAAQMSGSSAAADYTLVAVNQSDIITAGFAWRYTDATGVQRDVCNLLADAGVTLHNKLYFTPSSGLWQYTRSSATQIASGTRTLTQNTWCYIEVQTKLHDTAGSVIVRVDGTDVINATGLDTKNAGTGAVYDTLRIVANGVSRTNQYDDLYVRVGPSSVFRGDIPITALAADPAAVDPSDVAWDDPDPDRYVWDAPFVGGGFTDAVCDFQALTIESGWTDENGLFAAGHVVLNLDNRTGQYSQYDVAGRLVYYAPGRGVSIWAHLAGADWWLFNGRVESWTENADDTVTVEAVDGFAWLARDIGPFLAGVNGDHARTRITAIAAKAGFADRIVGDTGDVTLTAQTAERSPLEEIQTVALSDGGIVYVDADGSLTFRNRAWVLGRADQTTVDVFSDNVCTVPHIVWDATLTSADEQVANTVTLTNVAGLVATAVDTSDTLGVVYAYTHPNPDQWTTQGEGDALAAVILNANKTPRMAIGGFQLHLLDPNQDLWAAAINRRLGDRVEFLHDYIAHDGTATLDVVLIVTGITHEITPDAWITTVATSKTVDYIPYEYWDKTTVTWDDFDTVPNLNAVWRY